MIERNPSRIESCVDKARDQFAGNLRMTHDLFRTMFRTMADQKVAGEANESAKALFGGTRICRARPTLGQ